MHQRHIAAGFLLLASIGCHKRTAPVTPSPTPGPSAEIAPQSPSSAGPEEERAARERERQERIRATAASVISSIHFEFDEYDLGSEARSILDQKMQILLANPGVRLRATGHADERGSDEYNLALGQRRAAAAKRYLTQNGIDAARLEVDSLGEERPVCFSSDEDCRARNRRVDFEIIAGQITASLE